MPDDNSATPAPTATPAQQPEAAQQGTQQQGAPKPSQPAAQIVPIIEKKYLLKEKIDATPEVLVARFAPEDGKPMDFDPGMFMMISGIDIANVRHIARAFSISSDPGSVEMEFFIVKEPMHAAAPGISHFVEASVDDIFIMKGPNGQFRFDPAKDHKVFFIAGGTGLAPFMSMLRHMKIRGAKNDVKMMYSVKYPTEIILKDELDQLVNDLGIGMTITVTRPQPGDGWTGQTGHVAELMIKQCVVDVPRRMCYICGPLAFVKAVKDALAHCGVPPEKISADVWG